jgi:hypothetical protein
MPRLGSGYRVMLVWLEDNGCLPPKPNELTATEHADRAGHEFADVGCALHAADPVT